MPRPLTVLLLTHNYPRFEGDFAGVFISLLARRLLEHDIRPIVLAPHDIGRPTYEEMHGVPVHRFRYAELEQDEDLAYRGTMHHLVLGSVSGIFKFKRFLDSWRAGALDLISREKVELVTGHWLVPSGLVMKTLRAKTNLPMVMSSHGTDVRIMRKYFRMAYRYLRGLCYSLEAWTVVSTFLRAEMVRMDPHLADRIQVLPMPHDETVFFEDHSIARDPSLLVAVTRFTEQKRVDRLVRAFALVHEKCGTARLEIYGTGPLQAAIEERIAGLGLGSFAKIHPPVPQAVLRTVYNRASAVVLNSYQEGFGLALSEGMLCGAAVIGVDSGGIPDIIKHDERGLLADVDNDESLAEAMLAVMTDRARRDRLADAGRQFAQREYASGPLAGRFAELLRRAASKDRSDR